MEIVDKIISLFYLCSASCITAKYVTDSLLTCGPVDRVLLHLLIEDLHHLVPPLILSHKVTPLALHVLFALLQLLFFERLHLLKLVSLSGGS